MRLPSILVVSLLIASQSPALADPASDVYQRIEKLHGDASGLDAPLRSLVQAMRSGDAETIASLADYPLTVQANGETYDVQNEQDFIDNFDDLVAPETRRAVGRQQYGDLFVNSEGVMLANGAVWMAAVCEDDDCENSHWAITAINNE